MHNCIYIYTDGSISLLNDILWIFMNFHDHQHFKTKFNFFWNIRINRVFFQIKERNYTCISNMKEETSCPYWTLFEYGSCYAFMYSKGFFTNPAYLFSKYPYHFNINPFLVDHLVLILLFVNIQPIFVLLWWPYLLLFVLTQC